MRVKQWEKKLVILSLLCILLIPVALPALTSEGRALPDKDLPPPLDVDMILETSMCRRMSIREFTNETVSDEMLSTILWAAYGLRKDNTYTVSEVNSTHAAVIYVLNNQAAYIYDPENLSLIVFKEGDHRADINILQYGAPIQIGLCWDTSKAGANHGGTELGQIGQNIQFMANALGLGTVVTGQIPPAIKPLGLPANQEGLIIMPLGYPKSPYDFKEKPMWISPLPKVKESSVSLSKALENREDGDMFQGELSQQETSQLLWSSYGYSLFIDASEQEPIHLRRHRTVPSAHGYYPLVIYAVTEEGVYRYYPNIVTDLLVNFLKIINAPVDYFGLPIVTFLKQTVKHDTRDSIASLCNQPNIASAPLLIIPVLDLEMAKELSSESARRFWYYEAGAVAHNVLLEATAWDLSAKIIYPVNPASIRSILQLPDDNIPTLILPIGE